MVPPLHLLEAHTERRADGLVSREQQAGVGIGFRSGRLPHQRVLNEPFDNAQLELVRNLQALQAQAEPGLVVVAERCGVTLGVELLEVFVDESRDVLVAAAAALHVHTFDGVEEAHGFGVSAAALCARMWRG